jgi:hypothetical protein
MAALTWVLRLSHRAGSRSRWMSFTTGRGRWMSCRRSLPRTGARATPYGSTYYPVRELTEAGVVGLLGVLRREPGPSLVRWVRRQGRYRTWLWLRGLCRCGTGWRWR